MTRIRRLGTLLVVLCAVLSLAACGSARSNTRATSGPEPSSLRPSLIALSVSNLNRSVAWYESILGFEVTGRHEFPDDGLRMAFMIRDGFELELIELAGAEPFAAPDPSNPATRQGLVKLAFHANRLDELYLSATEAGAKVHSTLRNSNRTGGRFFILLDPDGNWIQVFGPAATPDAKNQ